MNAIEGHRYYNERTRLEEVIPLSTPFILYLDPSSICNLQCNFCPCGRAHDDLWSDEKKNSIGMMDFELYKKIIDDCLEFPDKIKCLRLYKEGEPLLNPRFVDMISYAKSSGKFIHIDTTTNGTLLSPELNRKIVESGLTRINISVEGISAEDYLNICGRKIDFDKFVDNIRDLYEHRENLHVFIKTVSAETDKSKNVEMKKKFYDVFGDICDEIAYEYVSPCWPGFDNEIHINEGIYGNEIQKCIVCPRIFYILTINSDGAATQCIVDWNRRMIVGDAKKQTLKEIWRNMDECRMIHLEGNRRTMVGCSECMEIEVAALDNIDDYRDELLKKFRMRGTE